MFELNNGQMDQAARAAVALTVHRLEKAGVAMPAAELGAIAHQVIGQDGFQASSAYRWTSYAKAVAANGEQVTNRRWADYSAQVKSAARAIANAIQAEVADLYEESSGLGVVH